jgi:S-DNA-T family DNA segregation ATPase FtsK/SpoIIIE
MAKSKRKGSSASSRKGVDHGAAYQIRLLLLALIFLFLLASVFDAAGQLGTYLHTGMRLAIGMVTPLIAVVLIVCAVWRYLPNRPHLRLTTVFGLILFFLALVGLVHSFVPGDALQAAQNGDGGGMLGYLVENGIYSLIGKLIGRLLLFVLMIASLILILDKALLPFLKPHAAEEEDETEETPEQEPARVRVAGQINAGGAFGMFKQRMGKPEVVTAPTKTKIPVVSLPRSANWNYPSLGLLQVVDEKPQAGNIAKRLEQIQKTLRDFGIDVSMGDVNVGPTVTQYTLKPSEGVKLNQITARQDDLALALSAQSLRVEAPIPGKGMVGIEIPNDKKAMVGLREVLESRQMKQVGSKLALALGRDAAGEPAVTDLARMPHALVAGATGSGKSVCINSIILTLLANNSPDELRLILVDPKRVELTGYNGIPHLLTPVITEPKDTVAALSWAVREMERRYKLFQAMGKRNIEQYNLEPDLGEGRLPFIVIIIDELADMMMVAAREVESSIVRLAQMARAVGIHLIVATQRPSVDVITGLIKANIPTRIAFAVASQIDSRTILDQSGAEKLLGYGDMLYVGTDTPKPKRIQGARVTEAEITAVIAHIRQQEQGDRYDPTVLEARVESRLGSNRENGEIDDDLFNDAYEVVKQAGKASTTLLQTRLSVGYARAARLMQGLEDRGMIGPANGAKPREVYGASMGDGSSVEEGGIAAYPENE